MEVYKTYNHKYIDKQWKQRNMNECDKRKSYINSKLHVNYISSNNAGHPVSKIFTTLHYTLPNYKSFHYTGRHFTSFHLIFTQLHFTILSFGLTPFKFPTAPFHQTSLHFTSLHFIALLADFRYTSFPFISLRL